MIKSVGGRQLNMIKRMFSLSQSAYNRLIKEADKLGISTSEQLRRVVDRWIEEKDARSRG